MEIGPEIGSESPGSRIRVRQGQLCETAYVGSIVAAGAIVTVASVVGMMRAPPVSSGWWVLAGLTILSGSATLRLPGAPVSFSISDTFTIAAALLFGPAAGTAAVALDSFAISLRLLRGGLPLRRLVFNVTAPPLAMWIAAHVFFRLVGVESIAETPLAIADLIVPLAIFSALYFVLNTGSIARAIAFDQRVPVVTVWRQHFVGLWLTYFGGAAIAAVLALLVVGRHAELSVLALVAPLPLILYFTFKSVVGRMQDQLDELANVNRLYRALVEGAVYGMFRAHLQGRFIDVNPALGSMLGFSSAKELLGRNLWTDVCAGANDQQVILAAVNSERISGVEMWWRRHDGTSILVRLSGRFVRDDRDGDYVEMIVEDVTERRALEEQLREAQKLDAVGRLARGVAHDFNNLLTVIVSSSELVATGLDSSHPAHEELREIQKAAQTAASLTRQLLTFSRQQRLHLVEVNVDTLVDNMLGLVERLVGSRVTLQVSLSGEGPTIRADKGQIEQVVMNLAINARDAMQPGGRLTIATSVLPHGAGQEATLPSLKSQPCVFLRVADTGTGMSDEVRAHIFEPFFTTKGNGRGRGLGLATVYGIVKQSGGEILVSSRLGQGTTFQIWLPLVSVSERHTLEPTPDAIAFTSTT